MGDIKILIPWKPEYELGIESVDTQHKGLVDIINEFYTAFAEGKVNECADQILEKLIRYTEVHFADEEKIFGASDYPDKEAHEKKHKEFVDKLKEYQNSLAEGKSMASYELMEFLRKWLLNHILNTDKAYVNFCKNNNN